MKVYIVWEGTVEPSIVAVTATRELADRIAAEATPEAHPRFGDGRVMEVDTTSFRVDLDTPIPFVTVLFFRFGLIYRPAAEMEHLLPQNV